MYKVIYQQQQYLHIFSCEHFQIDMQQEINKSATILL